MLVPLASLDKLVIGLQNTCMSSSISIMNNLYIMPHSDCQTDRDCGNVAPLSTNSAYPDYLSHSWVEEWGLKYLGEHNNPSSIRNGCNTSITSTEQWRSIVVGVQGVTGFKLTISMCSLIR